MMFECPIMQVARKQYSALFSRSTNISESDFFAQDDQIAVVKVVLACACLDSLDARQDNDMSDDY